MKKILFIIHNAWKYIIHNKYSSLVMLVAMTLGFLFPLIAVNDINDLLKDKNTLEYANPEEIAIAEYAMKYKEESEIRKALDKKIEEGLFDSVGFCATSGEIIYTEKDSFSSGVSAVSATYLSLANYELIDGKLFSNEESGCMDEKVCLLEKRSLLARSGVVVGDSIEILGNKFKVIGIIRAPRIYGGVIIPYASAPILFQGIKKELQYQMVLKGIGSKTPTSIANRLFIGENVISAQTAKEQDNTYSKSVKEINKIRYFRAVLVTAFACINIFILTFGMFIREQKSIALRFALGARRGQVQFELLMRNILVMIISIFLSVFLYQFVAPLINGTNQSLEIRTIYQVSFGGVCIVFIISSLVMYYINRKQDITNLLKK